MSYPVTEEPALEEGEGEGEGVPEVVPEVLPLECSSPGWRETPRDVAVLPGRYVFLNCRSSLQHRSVVWVLNGIVDVRRTGLYDRVRLFNGDHSMRFGPLNAEDGEVLIGCRIMSRDYGVLPSPLAIITVLSECTYTHTHTHTHLVDRN